MNSATSRGCQHRQFSMVFEQERTSAIFHSKQIDNRRNIVLIAKFEYNNGTTAPVDNLSAETNSIRYNEVESFNLCTWHRHEQRGKEGSIRAPIDLLRKRRIQRKLSCVVQYFVAVAGRTCEQYKTGVRRKFIQEVYSTATRSLGSGLHLSASTQYGI